MIDFIRIITKFQKNYLIISVLENGKAFEAFQQITVLNKINLNKLICIEFNNKDDATKNIINYIKKYYPEVEIKLTF